MQDRLIDQAAAAKRLGVSVHWVRRAVYTRTLPHVKVGRLVRFEPDALDTWIAERRVTRTTS